MFTEILKLHALTTKDQGLVGPVGGSQNPRTPDTRQEGDCGRSSKYLTSPRAVNRTYLIS